MGMVMINCPDTGHAIPTGLKMDGAAFKRAPVFFARVRCPACGREHEWFAKNAWVCESWMDESWMDKTLNANARPPRPAMAAQLDAAE